MASRYKQLVEAFGEKLAELQGQSLYDRGRAGWRLSAGQHSRIPDVTLGYRDEHRHEHAAPPRIVCIAQGGDLAPVDQPGGGRTEDGNYRANNRLTRQFKIKTEVWGASDTQSEALLHNSYLAWIHLVGEPQPGKPAVFSDELWVDQQPDEGGPTTYGSLISFLVMFEINVTDAPDDLTIVEAIDNRLHEQTPTEVTHVEITA